MPDMMQSVNCPYCGGRFDRRYYEAQHVPCPEPVTDTHRDGRTFYRTAQVRETLRSPINVIVARPGDFVAVTWNAALDGYDVVTVDGVELSGVPASFLDRFCM